MTDPWQILGAVVIIVAVLGLLRTAIGCLLRRQADLW